MKANILTKHVLSIDDAENLVVETISAYLEKRGSALPEFFEAGIKQDVMEGEGDVRRASLQVDEYTFRTSLTPEDSGWTVRVDVETPISRLQKLGPVLVVAAGIVALVLWTKRKK